MDAINALDSSWGLQIPLSSWKHLLLERDEWDSLLFRESLAIPFILSTFILFFQVCDLVRVTLSRFMKQIPGVQLENMSERQSGSETANPETFAFLTAQHKETGGWTIFVFTLTRVVACFCLVGFSVESLLKCANGHEDGISSLTWVGWLRVFSKCPESFMTVTYIYALALTLVSMASSRVTTSTRRTSALVLFSALAVYIYRDIWPLATFTSQPMDIPHDELFWVKFTLLILTTICLPLFVPRRYTPVDPKDPRPIPNDEQTCSLFSLAFYFYLDPIVFLGYRVPHLKPEQFPPLADTDAAKYVTEKSFPILDIFRGGERRHLFFGLMKVFRNAYIGMALSILGAAFLDFFSPIAINGILRYMETGGQGAFIRPWFWILCLFIGPTFSNVLFQWYVFLAMRTTVHAEAIFTQLVFEHSLRIRFVADGSKDGEGGEGDPNSITVAIGDRTDIKSVATNDSGEEYSAGPIGDESEVTNDDGEGSSVAPTETFGSTSTSTKGKQKETPSPNPKSQPEPQRAYKKDSNLIGKINNLVTTDLGNITDARGFLWIVLDVPLQITLCTVFLYQIIGWSAFVSLAIMVALVPLPSYAAKLLQDVQKERMTHTDARVQHVVEVVGVLRMVKLFGWESQMSKKIQDKRDAELLTVFKFKVLKSLLKMINTVIRVITMIATYATYTVIMKQSLTPSIIFSSLTVFSRLQMQLDIISWQISTSTQGKVSLDRLTKFFHEAELLDSFVEKDSGALRDTNIINKNTIGFRDAMFSWTRDVKSGTSTPSERSFRLRIDELTFKPSCINLIVGPTGSGKTSILMALLGEMHFLRNGVDSWFNLPRDGGVAYAAQESWVQSATIRENILFGSPYNEARYKKVIYQCALEKDLELFEAGDATEVGERGITLSGGQKARVTLARAIYSDATILLLDDVLAALDVHTSVWIVNKCLKGDLLQGRTVILVTHNVALLSPLASFIVSMGQDGTVHAKGQNIEDVVFEDASLALEAAVSQEILDVANNEVPELATKEAPVDGKLVVAEEITEGHVTWKSIKLFLSALGGRYPLIFYSVWISGFLISDSVAAFQIWFMGYWGSQYENHDPSEVSVFFYLGVYIAIFLFMMLLDLANYVLYVMGTMRASRAINAALVDSVLSSTLRWLDQTPTARIVTRFTQDIRTVDDPLASTFQVLSSTATDIMVCVGVIIIFTPIFFFPALGVGILGIHLGNIYLKAQLSAKREMSNAKAPVLAHFSAAISGIVSIRAYGAQALFMKESLKRLDFYIRIARLSYNLNRWIGLRINTLGSLFTMALGSYLVYGTSIGAANTGFSLNMTVDFCYLILIWVRYFNDFEVQSNSLERIQHYLDIEHEPQPTANGKPPSAWPTSGEIVVENLSARYFETGPLVLHNISFRVGSGQRIGVVGRTGSGKSSLTLALLRCIITEGAVYYDGLPTNMINLDALRSSITIIPQTPELISGTLRKNMDPFDQYDDATLNDALRSAGLFSLQEQESEARITLDSNIAAGGSNLSVGERQIIALARAMVRGSKLLILDEATSAIDYKTDAVIQNTLRHKLGSDVSVITIAHRLQTIMDSDKIMVLDEGRMVEFDSPSSLLRTEGGFFKALVDESGDKIALIGIAETIQSSSKIV